MTSISSPLPRDGRAATRPWRLIAGTAGAVAGAVIVTGAFLPWVETFAGLIQIPGTRGSYGQAMVAAGAVLAVAGLWHAARGSRWSRWLTGLGGFAVLGFAGYLLIQLAATMRALGGNSMVIASGGPGLWVVAGGGLLAFTTLFLPAPAAAAPPGRQPAPLARAEAIGRGVLSRTADLDSRGARRGLQIGLGLVWLLDAGLQFQPYMFGRGFVTRVLAPAPAGNPALAARPALWAGGLVLHDVAAWNAVFATIQLGIALGLLWRPTVKAALAGSVAWGLAVWWLGEGLGGLLTGTANPVTGAPGAALLYALIAVLAWPSAAQGPAGRRWGRTAWLVLWGGFAVLMLQPAVRAPGALRHALAGNAAGEPGWLAGLDRAAAAAAGSHGLLISAVLAAVFALIAAGIWFPATRRPAVLAAVAAALAIWVAGENFGMILMGNATDPNSGPLLVLLAAACWPWPARKPASSRRRELAAAPARG